MRVEGAWSELGRVFAREGVACEKADTRQGDWSGEGSHPAGSPAPGTMVGVWGLPASLLASWQWPPPERLSQFARGRVRVIGYSDMLMLCTACEV
jgi:hypothetical protein